MRLHLRRTRRVIAFAPLVIGLSITATPAAPGAEQAVAAPPVYAALWPAPGARNVCPDTRLRIAFAEAPDIGSGTVRVIDAADDTVVETIDVAAPVRTRTIGGLPNFHDHPVLITGVQAEIVLEGKALRYGKTYCVTVDAGAFTDRADRPYASVDGPRSWRFTTKVAPPTARDGRLRVTADGSGDFATVQGALDFIPEENAATTTIVVGRGTYQEILCAMNKGAIAVVGEDRKETVIAYANNERFNGNAGGNPFGPKAGAPAEANPRRGGAIYRRGAVLAHRVGDLVVANLTLRNTTPQGGSQAEALIVNGAPDAHAIITGVDLESYQDTIQINGPTYIDDCTITGDVDFIWGTGPCFMERCEVRALRSNAYYTQIRNRASNHGFVFKECLFDGAPGVTGNVLSRIAPARFPESEVVLINCVLTDAVAAVGWRLDQSTDAPRLHFWEYRSRDARGTPVETSRRLAASRQLTPQDDAGTIARYSDPTFVLGGRWTPSLAPILITQPAGMTVHAGDNAAFRVAVAAVPRATFQWRKDGVEIEGATGASYEISSASPVHAGTYTVEVRNGAGTVASAPARLTVTDSPQGP
jgi:pectin methylesterase-like acyl-CoA thioesterase